MPRPWPALLLAVALPLSACGDGAEEEHHPFGPAQIGEAFARAYEKADDASCSGMRLPDGSGFGKRIALTFDDGPHPDTTPEIIATLRRQRVPAAFFINGVRVNDAATRAIVREIAADPSFLLANHSWSHPDLARLSAAAVALQIDRNSEVLVAAGEAPRYFRFPYGSSTCATSRAARDRGYVVTGFNVIAADWCYAAGHGTCARSGWRYLPDSMRRDMVAYVLHQARVDEGGIVLLHDIHRYTAVHLDALIRALKREGFIFTRIDDAATFPRLNAGGKFIGSACATNAECTYASGAGSGFCHPAGFCSLRCEGYCPDRRGAASTFCVSDSETANPSGMCVSRAAAVNGYCEAVPGTTRARADRYVGRSSAAFVSAEVCLPAR